MESGDQSNIASDAVNMAQKGIQAAQTAAKVAKGAASGGAAGAAAAAAWEFKDQLPKLIACAALFVVLVCGMVASIPYAIIQWANNPGVDTSDGAKKTISSYQDMVDAMKMGLHDRVFDMTSGIEDDAKKHSYVTPESKEASEMVTPELRAALHTDIEKIIGPLPASDATIDAGTDQEKLAPDIIAAYTAQVTADAQRAQQNAADEARSNYETAARDRAKAENQQLYQQNYVTTGQYDKTILTQDLDRYIVPSDEDAQAQAAGTTAYNKVVSDADIPGKSPQITATVQTDIVAHPPRTIYKISDAASGYGMDDNSTALAIACYSVAEGNNDKASPAEFEQKIHDGSYQYFTQNTTESTNPATHQKTVTYSLSFVNNGAQKLFNLDSDQYRQSLQMAQNLLTFISHLKGNDDAGDLVMIDQISTAGGSTSGGGAVINLPGNMDNLPVSKNLIAFIESWEGFYGTAYSGQDYWNQTIGYGHVILKGETFTFLTQPQAEALLLNDLQAQGYISAVQSTFGNAGLNQAQFDALVSLAYNCGPGIFKKVSLTQDILAHADAATLQTAFESIDNVGGVPSAGLLRRRHAEWLMFTQGVYQGS